MRVKWWMVFGTGFVVYLALPSVGGAIGTVGAIWGCVDLIRWVIHRPKRERSEKPKKKKPDVRLPDWSVWDDSIHLADGQADRIQRSLSQSFPIVKEKKGGVSMVRGTQGDIYKVTLESCTCEDFKRRGLPCKHMYSLAIRKGLFDPAFMGVQDEKRA